MNDLGTLVCSQKRGKGCFLVRREGSLFNVLFGGKGLLNDVIIFRRIK